MTRRSKRIKGKAPHGLVPSISIVTEPTLGVMAASRSAGRRRMKTWAALAVWLLAVLVGCTDRGTGAESAAPETELTCDLSNKQEFPLEEPSAPAVYTAAMDETRLVGISTKHYEIGEGIAVELSEPAKVLWFVTAPPDTHFDMSISSGTDTAEWIELSEGGTPTPISDTRSGRTTADPALGSDARRSGIPSNLSFKSAGRVDFRMTIGDRTTDFCIAVVPKSAG